MNSIITKLFHSISYMLIAFLLFVLSSCYTKVDISSFEKSKTVNNLFQEEVIDSSILGTWQKRIIRVDGPEQVQQIIFDTNHNLLFEEELGQTFGDKLSGSFNTKDSILTIVLDYGYGTEKYYYEVEDETLTLMPIDMVRFFPFRVSGSNNNLKWINPNYDKSKL
jgi:hypothetical protein